MDGWIQEYLEHEIYQQLLSFVSLLSLGTGCTSWWVESWMLPLCDRFKAGCCCPVGTCLASDSSLLGVILKHPRRHGNGCRLVTYADGIFFGTKTCKILPMLKSYTSVLSQPLKDLTALAEVIHICHTYLPSGNR